MIPFLHIGWLTIPTFGLMVATAIFVAGFIIQAELNRRSMVLIKPRKPVKSESRVKVDAGPAKSDDGFLIVAIAGIAGLVGARLYHVLETPAEFFADPRPMLLTRYGFAWFGGFLGGFLALMLIARYYRIPILEFFDICAPAATVGYAIGRIGCLLSGDGDYGIPTTLPWGMSFPNGVVPTTDRVHPTPIYEFIVWMAIAAFLWRLGSQTLRGRKAKGEIFCNYLILTGLARFLVEFLRINPRSFFGLSNAQAASLVSIVFGAVLLWRIKARYHALEQGHRIVQHINTRGDVPRPEYHKPTCESPS
jgi:phosphatidylglycerol:prolipoprotein diacylglycerol transferase